MSVNLIAKLIRLAGHKNHNQHRLSATILYKGRPLAFGVNHQTKTNPKIKRYCCLKTQHAEMDAIWKVRNKELLKGSTIVIYRQDRHGNYAKSRPCSACMAMIKEYRIKTILYSDVGNVFVQEKVDVI